jgi:hypothetical protein
MGRIENDASINSSIIALCCRGNVCTEPLPNNTYRHTDLWEGFMKYAAEMGSYAMIYIPNVTQIGSSIQKLTGGIHRHVDKQTA